MKTAIVCSSAAVLFLSFLSSCKKEINPNQQEVIARGPGSVNTRQGFVYAETNSAGTNNILMFLQNSNGTLTYITSIPSGGNGSGNALGSQGALQLSDDNSWLFAVNAGSNSITSFNINNTGGITAVSTVSSNGIKPVSLSVHGNLLYVANAGSANISGYRIGENGTLTYITGSTQSLSAASAAPAQISFTPEGNYLLVTEKGTGKITTFPVSPLGVAAAANSSVAAGATPFGIAFAGAYLVLTEASTDPSGAAVLSAYSNGSPSSMNGTSLFDQSAAAWPVVTSDGKWVYIANVLGNAISTFSIDGSGSLSLANTESTTAVGPSNLTLSANEAYLYVINIASRSISAYKRRNNATLQMVGEVTGLPAGVVGIVAL